MDDSVNVDDETLEVVRERVLEAEKDQLHLRKAQGIIPDIKQIIEEEVQ
ncbi:hypothetical protein [Halorhabdus tiamatea]|nr:hypothetical protein [Halorhabdus tiamatea]